MKIDEIKLDVEYWYETSREWGTSLTATRDCGRVRRVDNLRYHLAGPSWSSNRPGKEDPKGRYIRVQMLDLNDREQYVMSTYIRDTAENVRARFEARRAAERVAEERRKERATAAAARAQALTQRLAAVGLSDAFDVTSTTGLGFRASPTPRVVVKFKGEAEDVLNEILDRLERQ